MGRAKISIQDDLSLLSFSVNETCYFDSVNACQIRKEDGEQDVLVAASVVGLYHNLLHMGQVLSGSQEDSFNHRHDCFSILSVIIL
jgi:hypothetical protein